MSRFDAIRQKACNANQQLPGLGLVKFTFGNASAADRGMGVFAIKPSGVPYGELDPGKMVIIDFEGEIVEGNLKPSSDMLTHALLYKSWHSVGGIVHVHSTFATAWSQSIRDIPIYGTTHADHVPYDIPCTEPMEDDKIRKNYEYETGQQILHCMKEKGLDPTVVEMILVGNHGPFAWGPTAERAVFNTAVLEELAKMAYLTEQLNPQVSRMKGTLIQKHYKRKHGPDAYYGQENN
jgi:L-ribulose-5-phosphate 4-epimerase